jgi:PhnB protein
MKLYEATFAQIVSVLEEGAMEISRRDFVTGSLSAAAVVAGPSAAAAADTTMKPGGVPMLSSYLLFDGSCYQAMQFYKSCFGGELTATKVKDTPAKDSMPAFQHEKIINARLKSTNVDISASDWLRPQERAVRGNTVCLYLSGGTFQELKSIFDKLSEGADVTDPLRQQFFGTYGALNDKFGVRWMVQTNDKS